MRVTVWHNIGTDRKGRKLGFDGYHDGHPLVPVFQEEYAVPLSVTREMTLEAYFHLFNVGDDPAFGEPDPRAITYRANRNRSLSVGDVISLTAPVPSINPGVQLYATTWFACQSSGWEQVPAPHATAIGANTSGTTSVARDTFKEV